MNKVVDRDISELILDNLKCVICSEYYGDMMQCYNGHPHCKDCLKKYENHSRLLLKREIKCCLCSNKKGWTTNRQMFKLATDFGVKIVCNIDGCEDLIKVDELEDHRRVCKHRLFVCPINGLECRSVTYDNLYDHVCEHKKLIMLDDSHSLNLVISEMVNYGPRTILYNGNVILLNCYVSYDRRIETRLIIKCAIIGPDTKSNVQIEVSQWNMLSKNNYVYCCKQLQMTDDFSSYEMSEPIALVGMKNYVSNLSTETDSVIMIEKVIHDSEQSSHNYGFKIHEFDCNEECQEIYVTTIKFSTK